MNFISQNTHFIDHLNKQPKPAAKLHMINTQMPNNDNHHPSTEVNNMLHTTYHHHITTCSDQCRIMDLPFLEFQGVAAGVVWCGVVWCGSAPIPDHSHQLSNRDPVKLCVFRSERILILDCNIRLTQQ